MSLSTTVLCQTKLELVTEFSQWFQKLPVRYTDRGTYVHIHRFPGEIVSIALP